MTVDPYVMARNFASDFLIESRHRTLEMVQTAASLAMKAVAHLDGGTAIDERRLIAELLHRFSVTVEMANALDDSTDHIPWLDERLGAQEWPFWSRYARYLQRRIGLPEDVVTNLDKVTRMVLERLEDPRRPGPWDRRGMVVGSVQSGKTSNYTGLICKAIDAGYKLVVVMAGTHSNLRAQTQLRLDEGVLGFDTKKSRKLDAAGQWIGVGTSGGPTLVVHSLTSSADDGDFTGRVADTTGVMLGGDPVVLVVKKNGHVLRNLTQWILHVAGSSSRESDRVVKNVSLLLIDDEADNASINTKGKTKPEDVTAINGHIRGLLKAFEKSAYVGYTATPFANIFINPDTEGEVRGEDLFPRSFIISLKPPSNYIGPVEIFGLDADKDSGFEGSDPMPIVRTVKAPEVEAVFPPRHRASLTPTYLPDSLKYAIRCFLLTCAARRARGQKEVHNSMLVHVTRFVAVQELVVTLIENELGAIVRRLTLGDGARRPTIREELSKLWESEFSPLSELMALEDCVAVTWDEVNAELEAASKRAIVLPINGTAREALDYKEHQSVGRTVIAVGGDKLSRGLTLEGLSISYFQRTSRMYDTLMQMGRWFGYRPGYLDLCRLFTTKTLVEWYRHVALAEQELRREFDYMVGAGLTPARYGLRVRTHPQGMLITAINKMSHGKTLDLSWQGTLVQTGQIPRDEAILEANVLAVKTLLGKQSEPWQDPKTGTRYWHSCDPESVAACLEALRYPGGSSRATGSQVASFVRKQATKSTAELNKWTVVLVSNPASASRSTLLFAGLEVRPSKRTPEDLSSEAVTLTRFNILDPQHEASDFLVGPGGSTPLFTTEWFDAVKGKPELKPDLQFLRDLVGASAYAVALALTKRWLAAGDRGLRKPKNPDVPPTRPNGQILRLLRRKEFGLLLLYPIERPTQVPASPPGIDPQLTGWAGEEEPLLGVVLSIPASNTAIGVEYRTNMIFDAMIMDDESYED